MNPQTERYKHMLLHKDKGLNPRMTYCPQCGLESSELVLLGAIDNFYICNLCGQKSIGYPKRHCSCGGMFVFDRKIGEYEKLPASQPCDKCQALNKEMEEEVSLGGVYWKCIDCGSTGVIKHEHQLSKDVRKQLNVEAPKPCGVEFTKVECPVCGSEG